jgi:hypothetical protein
MAPGDSPLTKPHTANSLARSTKSTLSPASGLQLLLSKKFQKLFHPPSRGAFHLSLAVLVHYRSQALFSLGWWSTQIQAGFLVSDPTQEPIQPNTLFSPTGLLPSMAVLSRLFWLIMQPIASLTND